MTTERRIVPNAMNARINSTGHLPKSQAVIASFESPDTFPIASATGPVAITHRPIRTTSWATATRASMCRRPRSGGDPRCRARTYREDSAAVAARPTANSATASCRFPTRSSIGPSKSVHERGAADLVEDVERRVARAGIAPRDTEHGDQSRQRGEDAKRCIEGHRRLHAQAPVLPCHCRSAVHCRCGKAPCRLGVRAGILACLTGSVADATF